MQDLQKQKLHNTYFAMRHGQSEANVAGIIASDPATGCNKYGLTDIGKQQVTLSVQNAVELKSDVRIICSDFLRTKETAEIAYRLLQTKHPIQYSIQLRERFFGELNGLSDHHYQDVWTLDKANTNHQEYGVESANQVVVRASILIAQLEERFTGDTFLLVAHGDVLQLLQTWFNHVPSSEHRELPHLSTAEIRCLNSPPNK
ncbi:MAG: histidine phosphatase family protein [Porticoccus sp.]|nr:histidine phosphatase family protein [Porticoccus sp.]